MAAQTDITGFHKDEVVEALFYAKNRDGTVLTSPATATVSMTIGLTLSGSPLLEFDTVTGQIVLVSAPLGSYRIKLLQADTTTLVEGKTYYYNLWTWQNATPLEKTLQVQGKLILQNSIGPT